MIPFNKPYLTGKEAHYIYQAVYSGKISGNGAFTKKCQQFFEERWKFKKTLLTTSCTDALEMCALLIDVKPGDEIIVPSYTFVSTALAFVRQGAKIIFADSNDQNPNIDPYRIEALISKKTKAIVVVHYAGIACDMDKIMAIADKYDLIVIEDAAQAIDSYHNDRPLGTIGHLSTFSFHETKNVQCGEGGLLGINDEKYIERSEIIWEKGTNRSKFFRGEIDKYGWVDIGSSFLPSDIIAAFLYAQLENLEDIQQRRREIWENYYEKLKPLQEASLIQLPFIPDFATNNAHMFYLVTSRSEDRNKLIEKLKKDDILAVFHYLSLHKSAYYSPKYSGDHLKNADTYTNRLLRLPLFYELSEKQQNKVINSVFEYYSTNL